MSFIRTALAFDPVMLVSSCIWCGQFVGASSDPQVLSLAEQNHHCPELEQRMTETRRVKAPDVNEASENKPAR